MPSLASGCPGLLNPNLGGVSPVRELTLACAARTLNRGSAAAGKETDDEQDEKDNEQDLGDPGCRSGDPTEAQRGSDQSNDEKR